MTENVGALDKHNTTKNLAFISVIAERKTKSNVADGDSFIDANPDLLQRDVLSNWYSKDRIAAAMARAQFFAT